MLADDRIVLCANADCGVLRRDELDGGQKNGGIFDVFRVGQNGAGERLLLVAASLVNLIENVAKFGIVTQHALVKVCRQRDAVFAKNGNSGLDKLDLSGGQHGGSLLNQ